MSLGVSAGETRELGVSLGVSGREKPRELGVSLGVSVGET